MIYWGEACVCDANARICDVCARAGGVGLSPTLPRNLIGPKNFWPKSNSKSEYSGQNSKNQGQTNRTKNKSRVKLSKLFCFNIASIRTVPKHMNSNLVSKSVPNCRFCSFNSGFLQCFLPIISVMVCLVIGNGHRNEENKMDYVFTC